MEWMRDPKSISFSIDKVLDQQDLEDTYEPKQEFNISYTSIKQLPDP